MDKNIRWSAHIVADDTRSLLPNALRALQAAEQGPDSVTVVDNAPVGEARPEIAWPALKWLRNPRPQSPGHSHNQAMRLAFARIQAEPSADHIILLLTPDVIVGGDLFTRLQRAFEADPQLAVAGPKLRRAHIVSLLEGERPEIECTDILDVYGLSSGLFGRVKPLGAGVSDTEAVETASVFAPTSTCFAVRLSAMRALSSTGPWFAESGTWERAAIGVFRRMQPSGRLAVIPDAVAWRLAPRTEIR